MAVPQLIGLILLLLLLSGCFSASETALLSLKLTEVRRLANGTFAERAISRLLRAPDLFLGTVLLSNTFVNVLLTSLCASLLHELSADHGLFNALLNIAMVTPLLIIAGEQTPKRLAFAMPLPVARAFAVPLELLGTVLRPLNRLMQGLVSLFLKLAGLPRQDSWSALTQDKLAAFLSASTKGGSTDTVESELLQRILRLDKTAVKDIMIPRPDVQAIDDSLLLRQAYSQLRKANCSRMPVYHDDLDEIWGVLSFCDYPLWRDAPEMDMTLAQLKTMGFQTKQHGRPMVYAPVNVPSNIKIEQLLTLMKEKGTEFAIVVGEHGGTTGVVTFNDVLMEIIGQFSENRRQFSLRQKDATHYTADGRMRLRDIAQVLGSDFQLEDNPVDTIAGLILQKLEHLPKIGETVRLPNHRLTVRHRLGNRIAAVEIEVLPPQSQEEEKTP